MSNRTGRDSRQDVLVAAESSHRVGQPSTPGLLRGRVAGIEQTWFILGIVFGGLGAFGLRKNGEGAGE